MIWSDDQILNATDQVANDFAREFPCIEKRYAIPVTASNGIYALPADLLSIRRITWNGWRTSPLPQRQYREVFQGSFAQSGRPIYYLYSDLQGQKNIRFFPKPNVTITASGNLYGAGIAQGAVLSYWGLPDVTRKIPRWLERRVVKAGSLAILFAQEGKGQDLRAAKFWDVFFTQLANKMGGLITYSARKLIMQDPMYWVGKFPASPVLPIDRFGIGVD